MPATTVKPVSRPLVHRDFLCRLGMFSTVSQPCGRPVVYSASTQGLVLALVLFAACAGIQAQTVNLHIDVVSTEPGRIRINAEFPESTYAISFPNAYGSALGLADRVEKLEARGSHGESIPVRKLASGEFSTSTNFSQISYEVRLSEPLPPAQGSHVSWLNRERGLLLLSDLLPRALKNSGTFSSAQIQLALPAGWTAASNSESRDAMTFFSDEPEKTVFLIGPQLNMKTQRVGAKDISVVLSGDWPIADKDALKIATQIVQEYSKMTGFELKRNAVVMLAPFPGEVGPERWTAESRGNAVVLLLGRKGSGKQVKSRLGIVLAHEVFHLWVPNSLKLAGDYDWFFEGFTIYQALRMDLRLHLISFKDYLDTIARVYDSYLSSPDRDNLSLIQASERRWTTLSSLVYDKAMLVAFLYDLHLRRRSVCKASFDDLYRQLFQRVAARQSGANETIIDILNEQLGQETFAHEYVEGVGIIDLDSALSPYGISVRRTSSGTKLSADHANKAEKKILDCLAGK